MQWHQRRNLHKRHAPPRCVAAHACFIWTLKGWIDPEMAINSLPPLDFAQLFPILGDIRP